MQGQSGPEDLATVLGSAEIVSLYQCFPYCETPEPPPPPPPVPFSGRVNEASSPNMGTGRNGGVASCAITMTGDRNGTTSFSTDGAGNYSNQYFPESMPTLTASKWGLSTTGSPGSTMTLYTDATVKLGLGAGSAPAADGATFALKGNVNGGTAATLSRALTTSTFLPVLIKIPRNGDTTSSLNVNSADHPRFTWAGEPALNLNASAGAGKIASATMRFDAIHKWVKVHVDLTGLFGPLTEDANDAKITVFSYLNDGAGKPVYTNAFGLPTATTATGTVTQPNPMLVGERDFYVSTLGRLGTAAAPYHAKFRIHLENDMLVSSPLDDNETFTITDAMRKSGTGTITIKMMLKGSQK